MATAQASTWAEHTARAVAKQQRAEPWHCVVFTDLHALAEHQGTALQHLKTLCSQGPRAGIVPLLIKRPVPDWLHQQNAPMYLRQLAVFWGEVLPQAWGLSWPGAAPTNPDPMNQDPELWRLLTKFGLTLQAREQGAQADRLIDALTQQQAEASDKDFVNVPIGQSVETASPWPFAWVNRQLSPRFHRRGHSLGQIHIAQQPHPQPVRVKYAARASALTARFQEQCGLWHLSGPASCAHPDR